MATNEGGGSRPTNCPNSVNRLDGGNQAVQDSRELPTPEERATEFFEEYPELAHLPVTAVDGRKLRRDFAEPVREEWTADSVSEFDDAPSGVQTVGYDPITWGQAVERLLSNYEDTRRTTVNLERGRPGGVEYAEFSVEAETRWMVSNQKRYFAQLKGWMRELTGGERPSGGYTPASFDDPYIVLLSRSASSTPDGERLAPTDHEAAINESWEPCYHTLRNTLRSMGYELGEDWQYERREEPHTGERGGGVNHCYGHEHTVLVVDGPVEEEDFRPVLEKHVEECDPASADAHQVGEAVEVFTPDEKSDVAAYIADYAGIEPTGLLERKIEYVAWAAAKDAANTRTKSRSDAANWASTADACKQRYESDESEQDRNHADAVVRSDRRGCSFECAECGSPHGIDQEQTLTAHRLLSQDSEPAVADGGSDIDREERLRDRWPSARAAASVGERPTRCDRREEIERLLREEPGLEPIEILARLELPPSEMEFVEEVRAGVDHAEPVGFERLPDWRVESVTVGHETYPASAGGGVELVEVMLPRPRLVEALGIESDVRYRCECGVAAYGATIVSHLGSHGVSEPAIADGMIAPDVPGP